MIKKSLLLLLLYVLPFSPYAQSDIHTTLPLSEADPAEVDMSAARLARIDSMCLEAIANGEVPGMVALVARNGHIVYHKAFGKADHRAGRDFKKDDIFRIASQTKAITSTAVMMLWEEGKFQLDDPISKYIPEFKDPQVLDSLHSDGNYTTIPANKEITIRHLLTHTSGLGYGVIDGDERFRKIYAKAGITDLFTTEDIPIGESVEKLAVLPLHHNPGEKFTYSEGLDVLGYFIEVVSGMPLDQYFRTKIFDPLGMDDTWFYLPKSKHDRLVPIQMKENGKWITYPTTFYDPNYPIKGSKRFFSGGAGLSSTAEDYATFLQMYLNNGELNGTRLLARTTVQAIMANQIGDLMGDSGSYYGLAFGVLDQKGQDMGGKGSIGTFEWGGYFNTQYFADPQEKLIGILMKQTQKTDSDNTSWKFKLLVGQAVAD
ncbi:MAG: serine hydrolase domain-containing protein [Sediminicola sp.]